MVCSMTGFGRGEAIGGGKQITVELKGVNHRYAEVSVRLPRMYGYLEEPLKRTVLARVSRGRIEMSVNMEDLGEKTPCVKVDKALAVAYHVALKDLAQDLGISPDFSLNQLISLPDVVKVESREEDSEEVTRTALEAVGKALVQFLAMRSSEGQRLAEDMGKRLKLLGDLAQTIEGLAPQVVEQQHSRLQERLQELLGEIPVDEQRLAQEVAYFADRVNVTEELVRLHSHGREFAQTLALEGEAVGRKLDFLVQEMNREFNTIGSKANHGEIARMVVEGKSELEKIREQIQNLE